MSRIRLQIPMPGHALRRACGVLLVLMLALAQEMAPYGDRDALIERVVQGRGFNYWGWEIEALRQKFAQNTAGTQDWLSEEQRRSLVHDYFDTVAQIEQVDGRLDDFYARRATPDAGGEPEGTTLRARLDLLRAREAAQQPFAEAILEEQISSVLADMGFGPRGGVFPPLSSHFTPLPAMLIVSPRDKISQIYAVGLEHGLSVDQQETLEAQADQELDARSLVVPIGGLAMYPSMLLETSSFTWVVEAISHEWTHHWLVFHPLGYGYEANPETRIINETVASIAGREIAQEVLRRYYPDAQQGSGKSTAGVAAPAQAGGFDYTGEMHATRVHVDELLRQGKVDQAEAYMEARRRIFVANGYTIRKLNQAYFAFYGGYQAQPGGAAGEDPIGPAVRQLREQSPSLKAFLDMIAGVTTLDGLHATLNP